MFEEDGHVTLIARRMLMLKRKVTWPLLLSAC
jgi:hypothetical protein